MYSYKVGLQQLYHRWKKIQIQWNGTWDVWTLDFVVPLNNNHNWYLWILVYQKPNEMGY